MARATIRPATQDDIPGIVALQRACFPPPFPDDLLWQPEHIENHLKIFPEGQFIAESDGEILASATNILVTEEDWQAHFPWETITGGLDLHRHNPDGTTLYGIDISVHPNARKQGIGRRLYKARFDLVKELGLTRYGTVCRIPGFQGSPYNDVEEYVQAVKDRQRTDRTLTPFLKMNMTVVGLIPNYLDDPESADYGVILERK